MAISSTLGARAVALAQFAVDVADLAHLLDHVDGDADGAALVGDGAADGLANPPGGIGGEAEAAGVFELVHRPHQPRVALLDQVQEAQPAVAVAFGDGDDEAEVSGDEVAAGGLVGLAQRGQPRQPPLEPAGRFQRDRHEVAKLLAKFAPPLGRAGRGAAFRQLAHQAAHPLGDLLQGREPGLNPLHPHADLLDQPGRPPPPSGQPFAGGGPLDRDPRALAHGQGEVLHVLLQKMMQRAEIRLQEAEHMPLLRGIVARHLDDMVETDPAGKNLLEGGPRHVQHVVRGEDTPPQAISRLLDLPSDRQLRLPAQQRDVTHLHEIGANGTRLVIVHRCLSVCPSVRVY